MKERQRPLREPERLSLSLLCDMLDDLRQGDLAHGGLEPWRELGLCEIERLT